MCGQAASPCSCALTWRPERVDQFRGRGLRRPTRDRVIDTSASVIIANALKAKIDTFSAINLPWPTPTPRSAS